MTRQRVKHSKAIVCVIATILGLATVVAPGRIYYEVLWPITAACAIFFHWCDRAAPEAIDARFSYAFYLVAACAVLFVTRTDASENVFCRGLLHFVAPLAVCREANSMRQGLGFIVAHFGILLQKTGGDVFGEGGHWLACTIIIDHIALSMLRTMVALQDARQAECAAYDTFHRLLSFMCDGYFVSRVGGGVIAMDQKTASLVGEGPDFTERDLASVVRPSSDKEGTLMPGLKMLQLRAQNGEDFQVEMYTSTVVPTLLQNILPFLVGRGGFCAKPQFADAGSSFVFHAFRILGQVTEGLEGRKRELGETERWGEVGQECRRGCGEHIGPDAAGGGGGVAATFQADLQSIDEDSVSEEFEESSFRGLPFGSPSVMTRDRRSLGSQIDRLLGFLKAPPNEMLAACSDKDVRRQDLKALRMAFKSFVFDAYMQTHAQVSGLCPGFR